VSPSSVRCVCRLQVFMAFVAFKFSWRVSPSSFLGVCRDRLHVLMACVAVKSSWRVWPSSFSGVCGLQVLMACVAFKFSWCVSPSSFHRMCRLYVFTACVAFKLVFMACVAFKLVFMACVCVCVKMLWCFVPGCSNRSDKDPEKRLCFHSSCRIETKSWQKKSGWTSLVGLHVLGKTLENVYVCNDHFTGDCHEVSYRYDLQDAKIRERNSESVLSQFLAPHGLNKPSKILRLQWYKKSLHVTAKK